MTTTDRENTSLAFTQTISQKSFSFLPTNGSIENQPLCFESTHQLIEALQSLPQFVEWYEQDFTKRAQELLREIKKKQRKHFEEVASFRILSELSPLKGCDRDNQRTYGKVGLNQDDFSPKVLGIRPERPPCLKTTRPRLFKGLK